MNDLVILRKLVGPLILKTQKSFQFTDEPKFFQYTSFVKNDNGSALDNNNSIAEIKSLGECIERTCLATFEKNDFIKNSYSKLKNKSINPVEFINYAKITSKVKNNSANAIFNWTYVTNYFTNKKVLVPAQIIYVPYKAEEFVLRNPISSGAACAFKKEDAIYRGVCELIERDAFMLTYLNKQSAHKIPLDIINNKEIKEIIEKFKRYFIEVNLFLLSEEFIPSVLCVLVDRSGVGPAVSVGAKTDFDTKKAIRGALLEAQHTRLWIRYQMMQGKKSPKKLHTLEDRGLYWAPIHTIEKISFLLDSKNFIISLPKNIKNNKLEKIMDLLNKKGYEVYIKDITMPVVSKHGLCVWKVVIPKLHPLYLFEDLKYLCGGRIGNEKKNSIPHPFV